MSHNFTTVALLPCLRRSVRADDHVRGRIIPLAFLMQNYKQFSWFSPCIFQSPDSTFTLTLRTKTITTVHTTQSHVSANSLNETSVCVCLKNINKVSCQQVGVLYRKSCELLSGLKICTSYVVRTATGTYLEHYELSQELPFIFVLKVV